MFRKIGAFIAVLLLGLLLVACGNDTKTIIFEVNGGTNLNTVEFAESYKLTDLDKLVTTKPGYTLDGWYTTSTLDETSKVTSDLTKSVTLYAKWLIVEYTITYHLDGGTNAVNNPAKFTILDEVTLESPIKESYVFSGWYLESNFKTNVEKIEKGITQNIDVYAKWQSESVETVKVTWKNFDGTVLKVDENVEKGSLPVFTGQTPTKPSTAEFTYTFNGWTPEVIYTTTDVEYTALFSESKNKYTVTWKNHDGTTLLVSQDVFYGTTPSYTGSTPIKAETQTHTYTFKGWSPAISEVIGNVTYTAVFEEVAKTSGVGQELNTIFGFDIYALMPSLAKGNVEVTESSDDDWIGAYIDLYGWSEADVTNYESQLIQKGFEYDADFEMYFFNNEIFLYFDFDDDLNVYFIDIYMERTDGGSGEIDAIGEELNDFFGFDIYALIPKIESNQFELSDSSEEGYFGSYVDLYDWTESSVDAYITQLLDLGFAYDEAYDTYYTDLIYIYFAFDEDLNTYYMDIYTIDEGGVTPSDIGGYLNEYFQFDIYSTIPAIESLDFVFTEITDQGYMGQYIDLYDWDETDVDAFIQQFASFGFIYDSEYDEYFNNIDIFIFIDFDENINAFYIAIYTYDNGDVEPTEIGDYLNDFFGFDIYSLIPDIISNDYSLSDSSEDEYVGTYIDLFDWEQADVDQYETLLELNGFVREESENGPYFVYDDKIYIYFDIYEDAFYMDIYMHMDDLGDGGNGGEDEEILSWDDLITYFSNKFNLSNLNVLLPMIDEVTDFETNMIGSNYYEVMLARQTIDVDEFLVMYDEALLSLNWVLENGKYVYALSENHALTLDIEVDGELILFTIRKHLLNVLEAEFDTLSNMQTVNNLQKSLGDASGLPSMGTFDVLVIPVEINGVPFDMDYLDKLELVFNGTSEETGWESVSSFYAKSSFGLLNLSFDIVDKIETNNGKNYFEDKKDNWDENNGDGYAIKEVLTKADPNIDFNKYDVNEDGYIDSIIFVYSVDYRNESSDLWWAWVYLASQGDAKDIELDGLIFEYYMWVSYSFLKDPLSGEDLPANAETYIHELGHLLGLPDLYPYETSGNGPLGGWDMMDNNNGDHGPFNKLILGWLNPLIGNQGTYRVELDSYSTDLDGKDSVIIIPRSTNAFNDGNAWDEFIMIMFYTPEGLYEGHMNDRFKIRNAGVVIYHVDARLTSNPDFWTYFMQDNEGKTNLLVGLLEADKNNSIPGNTSVSQSDILTSGGIDLSTYKWNQGGSINVTIDIESDISNTSSNVSLILNIA